MYGILFKSVWDTIKQFAADHKHLGAETGMISILHTWGQNLAFHPHLHCIVPGGGLTPGNKWKTTKSNGKFLYPVKALSAVFRGKFCDYLIELHNKGDIVLDTTFDPLRKYLHPFYKNKWVVYAKLPMYNSKQVLEYLSRYTHRVAISNHRIKCLDDKRVHFSWLNYRNAKVDVMQLTYFEFLQKVSYAHASCRVYENKTLWYFGFLQKESLFRDHQGNFKCNCPGIQEKGFPWQELFVMLFGQPHDLCPKCKCGTMRRIASFKPDYQR